jgi:hypothetical protein
MLVACFMLKLLSAPECKRWPTATVAKPKARCNPPPLVRPCARGPKTQILGKAQQIERKDRRYLGEQDERWALRGTRAVRGSPLLAPYVLPASLLLFGSTASANLLLAT